MAATKLIELDPGKYSLLLDAGSTQVDDIVADLGHEPNGYFWAGVARRLVATEVQHLDGRFGYDPEAGMFCAYGTDREALAELGGLLDAVASDGERIRAIVAEAEAEGFDFDD
ncbi:Imm51 family immunity protein [Luedemannella helvata]|uniref:Immunity protein 51 of polymorphic toxin system n=1 Tax=Luedemannella helvata TaxID=349315 RepID=A0ABP4WHA1_9ACTN